MDRNAAGISSPWYRSLSRQQWGVLIASNFGWLFDGFEIFALFLTVGFALHQLLDAAQYPDIPRYAGYVLAIGNHLFEQLLLRAFIRELGERFRRYDCIVQIRNSNDAAGAHSLDEPRRVCHDLFGRRRNNDGHTAIIQSAAESGKRNGFGSPCLAGKPKLRLSSPATSPLRGGMPPLTRATPESFSHY